jgi:RNA polymerase sigma-70 factor (ECF subfamily)
VSTSTTSRLVVKARDPSARLEAQHAAFTKLVQRFQHVVIALALALLRDVDEAKDAAQDAYGTAWHRLRQLRDPAMFEAWLKAIVRRECSRRRRRQPLSPAAIAASLPAKVSQPRSDYDDVIATTMHGLPEGERQVTVLFYFLGFSQRQIAQLLGLKIGTVGKRMHSARLRMRRNLPRSVRQDFVRLVPSAEFVDSVRRGLLDEYVGEYHFPERPGHPVRISRDGDSLISEAGDQRHLLVSGGKHSLLTIHYDGEGRFRRNRAGEITHFVYYEFGKRMGVARKA